MKHAKRMLSFLLLLALLSAAFVYGSADTPEPEKHTCGDFTYILLEDGTAEIIRYSGKDENPVIPSDLDGHTVTAVGSDTFFECDPVSVTIPDSVTVIGEGTFSGCDELTVTVSRDSYAMQYCMDNGLNYTFPDAND